MWFSASAKCKVSTKFNYLNVKLLGTLTLTMASVQHYLSPKNEY